jgi:hypothetical protein
MNTCGTPSPARAKEMEDAKNAEARRAFYENEQLHAQSTADFQKIVGNE